MSKRLFLWVLFFGFFFAGCVTDKDLVRINERLDRIDSAQKKLSEDLSSISQSVSGVDNRLLEKENKLRVNYAKAIASQDNILNEISKLRGEFERLGHDIDLNSSSINNHQEKISTIVSRVGSIETFLDFEKSKKADSSSADVKKTVTEDKTLTADRPDMKKFDPENAGVDDLYKKAKKEFDMDHLNEAEKLFSLLLKKYGKSEKADNAAFWIGEIYYRKGDFKRAIVKYQDVIEKYPKGNKVASSYLKQGLAFFKLGRKNNAKAIFNILIKKYPSSNEAIIAKRKLSSF